MPTGFVYFVRNPSSGHIKIGYSASPAGRLSQLQTGHADRLHILATIPGDTALESWLHRKFAGHRLNGEWFQPATEIVEYIAAQIKLVAVSGMPTMPPRPVLPPTQPIPPRMLPMEAKELAEAARAQLAKLRAMGPPKFGGPR